MEEGMGMTSNGIPGTNRNEELWGKRFSEPRPSSASAKAMSNTWRRLGGQKGWRPGTRPSPGPSKVYHDLLEAGDPPKRRDRRGNTRFWRQKRRTKPW